MTFTKTEKIRFKDVDFAGIVFFPRFFFFYTFALLIPALCKSQAPATQWQATFGGSEQDICNAVQQTSDGGFIAAGYTLSSNDDVTGLHGLADFWVVKTSTSGTIQWQKCLGGTDHDFAFDVRQTTDGGYVVAGYTHSTNGDVTINKGVSDYWIVKLNASGAIQWQKTYGGSSIDYAYSIQQTADGGYIVLGETMSTDGDVTGNHGSFDLWVIKLSSLGEIQWKKTLGGSGGDYAAMIKMTSDGGYIITGNTYSTDGDIVLNHGENDLWIIKISGTGTIQWKKTFGGSYLDEGYDVQQTADGGYVVGGRTGSNNGDITQNHGYIDYWLIKVNSSGTLQWQKTYGGWDNDSAKSVIQTNDGGYIIAGGSTSMDVIGDFRYVDYLIYKVDSSGNFVWQKVLGGSQIDIAEKIKQTADGGYIVAGYSNSLDGDVIGGHDIYDFWLVKLASDELSNPNYGSRQFMVYPNPAISQLQLYVPETFVVDTLSITDSRGRKIYETNRSCTQVDIEHLAPGIYFIQVSSENKKFQTKFIKQ